MMKSLIVKAMMTAIWAMIAQFLMPIHAYLSITFCLIVSDFVTGIMAARQRKEVISSKGFGRTVRKLFLYMMAIMLAHGVDEVFFKPKGFDGDLVWIVSGFIAITEFKSNLENISQITNLDIWDLIRKKVESKIGGDNGG